MIKQRHAYPERDLNPHAFFKARDFKSFLSVLRHNDLRRFHSVGSPSFALQCSPMLSGVATDLATGAEVVA